MLFDIDNLLRDIVDFVEIDFEQIKIDIDDLLDKTKSDF